MHSWSDFQSKGVWMRMGGRDLENSLLERKGEVMIASIYFTI